MLFAITFVLGLIGNWLSFTSVHYPLSFQPAPGFVLAMLLRYGSSAFRPCLLGMLLSPLGAFIWDSSQLPYLLLHQNTLTVGVLCGWVVLVKTGPIDTHLRKAMDILRLLIAAIIPASLTGAVLTVILLKANSAAIENLPSLFLPQFLWQLVSLIGSTPLFLALRHPRQLLHPPQNTSEWRIGLCALLVVNLAYLLLSFFQPPGIFPDFFLFAPFIMYMAYRFENIGASLSVFITILAGSIRLADYFAEEVARGGFWVSEYYCQSNILLAVSGLFLAAAAAHERANYRELGVFFNDALKVSNAVLYRFNVPKNKYDYVSNAVEDLMGYTADEFKRKGMEHTRAEIHPDDLNHCDESIAHALKSWKKGVKQKAVHMECRRRHKQGHYRWVSDWTNIIFDDQGNPIAYSGSVYDITAQKNAEEKIAKSEANYRALIERATDGILIAQDNHIILANPAACAILGYTDPSCMDGRSMDELVHYNERANFNQNILSLLHGEDTDMYYVMRLRNAEGKYLWTKSSLSLIQWNGESAVLNIFHDITTDQQNDERIRRSEELYRLLAENASDMIWKCKPAGTITYVSPASQMLMDKNPLEVMDRSIYEFVPAPDRVEISTAILTIIESKHCVTLKHRLFGLGKKMVWVETTIQPFEVDDNGGIRELLAVSRDISEQRVFELSRNAMIEKLANLTRALGDIVYEHLIVEDLFLWHGITEELFGLPQDQMGNTSSSWVDRIHPDDVELVEEEHNRAFETEESFEIEYRMEGADGEYIWVRDKGYVQKTANGEVRAVNGVIQDITEEKWQQENLSESEERFRMLFENISIGVALLGLDGELLHVNNALCEMLGYHPDEMLDVTLKDVSNPKELENARRNLTKVVNREVETYQRKRTFICKDGKEREFLVQISALRDDDFQPIYLVLHCTPAAVFEKLKELNLQLDEIAGLDFSQGSEDKINQSPPDQN